MGTRVVLTYQDYGALPADGRRYELHEGELFVAPAPSPRHQKTVVNLLLAIAQHVKSRNLGDVYVSPIDCILSDTTVVQPDLVYLEPARLSYVTARGIEGPPTLVVEILSPTISIDRAVKFQLYARHGVAFYWIVDPDARSIDAYRLIGDRFESTARLEGSSSAVLPPFDDLTLRTVDL
jgi:Uma2 family endonuclease